MKKLLSLLCVTALLLTFAACAKDYSDTMLTGQVTAVSGTKVTLQLGSLNTQSTDTQNAGAQGSGQTPPSMPSGGGQGGSGQAPSDAGAQGSGQTPPSMPSGDASGMPNAAITFTAGEDTAEIDVKGATVSKETGMNTTEASLDDIAVGQILVIVVGSNNAVTSVTIKSSAESGQSTGSQTAGGAPSGGGTGNGTVSQGTSATTIDTDGTYASATYTSTGDDENALRVDGATVTLDGVTVNKAGGSTSSTETGDFYGMNAALLATNGATVTIRNAAVTSSAQNGNGVFSYGSGTTVNISDSTITTTADNSGGIQTTGGGTTNASNLTVTTSGSSAAAIRSDRGGGTVNVDGGTYISNGYNSPAIYSTAAISVQNAVLTANNSEALVIEGQNSIALTNCTVSGNMSDTKGTSSDENVHNVMIYQSMSGDANVGTSSFSMTGGSLTSRNGDLFYITNTNCTMTLSGVTLANEDTDACLLRICGNSASHGWGTAGSNGAQVSLTADSQTLTGNIAVDTISKLNLTLENGSILTGTVNISDNAAGGTAVSDNAVITIGSGCTWTLTGNCTASAVTNNGTINYNGYTITLADGSVLG